MPYTGEILREKFNFPFSNDAVEVFNLTEKAAVELSHNYIGTEHVLLGLIKKGIPPALLPLNLGRRRVKKEVEFVMGKGDRVVVAEVHLTPRAKKVVEFSIEEAKRTSSQELLPRHLWLGLVDEGEGIAAGILEYLGVLHKIRPSLIHEDLSKSLYRVQQQAMSLDTYLGELGQIEQKLALDNLSLLRSYLKNPHNDSTIKMNFVKIINGAAGLITPEK